MSCHRFRHLGLTTACFLTLFALAQRASAAEPAEDSEEWYYNTFTTDGNATTSNLLAAARRGLEEFEKQVPKLKSDGHLRDAATFARSDYWSSIRDDHGHVVIVCFDKATKKLAPAIKCQINGLSMRKGVDAEGEASPALSLLIQPFSFRGIVAIPMRSIIKELKGKHGDDATLIAQRPGASVTPPPVFYFKIYDRFELPGYVGIQFPIAAYGGIAGKNGVAFSLLAPAFSWGVQWNLADAQFSHVGLGVLFAPAILESENSNKPSTGDAEDKPAFTLKRLAVGPYIDLSGYVWIGGGGRFDFTSSKDHAGMIFLVIGPELLSKVTSTR